ncbi:type II toxin-antitoxin system RelE/ParE family toxin [Rhodohalobacter sulfatireducens]|uniref:Type II toxin-antitoxin system RelE/ParE family toxin n=1 Tax=Rhodohalobacter sulfatireducens TaxID=2911366 RepID=A0ABS9KJX6_9BACT|nr:type II toxin-antitoxin system RelE/ParE family toxin [Rhodohalobacter sulfatireducens]MCG2591097.1 type II toxin-antitoxin system RelE/ParE family toxin [Rhodohalobacter sulfatireducens]
MAQIRWTPQSLDDIEHIAEYIARDSQVYSSIQTQRFFEAVKILEDQIRAGRVVPEMNDDSIREVLLGYYRIIYRVVNENQADILTVHHSRRDPESNKILKSLL